MPNNNIIVAPEQKNNNTNLSDAIAAFEDNSENKTWNESELLFGLDDPDAIRKEETLFADVEELQKVLLGAFMQDDRIINDAIRFINPTSFTIKAGQIICSTIFSHYENYKVLPTMAIIQNEIKLKLKDSKNLDYYLSVAQECQMTYEPFAYPLAWVRKKIELHARRAANQRLIQKSITELKKPIFNLDAIQDDYIKGMQDIKDRLNPDDKREVLTIKQMQELPPLQWLIQDHYYMSCFATVFGASGSGKSFICLDHALSIACGVPYLNKYKVRKGKALYICSEGSSGMGDRVQAWLNHHNIDTCDDLIFLPASFDLMRISEAREILDKAEKHFGCHPDFIVIDTLSRNIGSGDDRTNDINKYIESCDYIRKETGATVVSVHHTGHENTKRPRGAKNITDASDVMLRVTPYQPDEIASNQVSTITQFKVKEGEAFADYTLKKRIVLLDDISDATSCVWTLTDGLPTKSDDKRDKVLAVIPALSLTDTASVSNTITAGQIVEQTGLSEDQVNRTVRTLVKEQFIYRDKFGEGNKSRLSYQYWTITEI